MKRIVFCCVLALGGLVAAANAATIITSYGTVTGPDDSNQAGPMWGQTITPDVGASPAGPHGTLYLQSMEFQTSNSTLGPPGNVYLHVYDDFATGPSGDPSVIGNLVAVSTNTLDMNAAGMDANLKWDFVGNVGLTAANQYTFVTALDQNEATLLDFTNLGNGGQFALNTGDPYAGGDSHRQGAFSSGWDMEFQATFSDVAVPEPTSLALLGLGGIAGIGMFQRRRK